LRVETVGLTTVFIFLGGIRMIKQIGESELNDCLNVIHESFMTVANDFGLTIENCPTNGAFMPFNRLQNDLARGHLMFAFYAKGKAVGFMQLSKQDNYAYELEKLAVLPQNRHNGYGKELINFAKSKVLDLGASKITIGIIEENIRLKDWYTANGFIHTGTRVFAHLPFTVGFMECAV
jgi:ribosomal protein S18 acetylase RimI-like enzyme